MDFKQAIKEIKVLLGMEKDETEVKFETAKLKDGTIIEYENLEVGTIVYVVTPAKEATEDSEATEKTTTPAPEGSHELEDGTIVTVDAEGKITEVKPKEEEPKEEPKVENAEQFKQKFQEATNEELTSGLNWMLDYVYGLENKVWSLQTLVDQHEVAKEEMSVRLAKIEGAMAAMFGQFEKMEPMATEFSTIKEKVETIESTPAGKSIFTKEAKDEKTLTLAEQRIEAIKNLKTNKK